MNKAIYNRIKTQFAARVQSARTQGDTLKPQSAAYQKKQAEFFTGAMAAMVAIFEQSADTIEKIFNDAAGSKPEIDPNYLQTLHGKAMPPAWVFGIMRGDDLLAEETDSSTKQQ